MFQQITGINSVIYYADSIILSAHQTTTSQAIWFGAIVAFVNCAVTVLTLVTNLIERVGRRMLILASLLVMIVGLSILIVSFYYQEEYNKTLTWLTVLGLSVYVAGFAPGMGPLPWAINSEIFPMSCRSVAASITTTTNWIFNSFVSLTFLSIAAGLGTYHAFFIYLVACFGAFVYFYVFLPVTRGIPLERIPDLFEDRMVFGTFCGR